MEPSSLAHFTFGLVLPPGSDEAAARFDAFAELVRSHASVDFARNALGTYKELAESVRDGSSDVAWLPPVVYAWLVERVNPIGSIVRPGGGTGYASTLVVRDDSPIRSLADLAGTRAGWVDPWSAAGYVVPRLELARQGIIASTTFSTETFHGSHRAALRALARGECDVVGTYARASEGGAATDGAWSELADALDGVHVRVLATFGSIPPDVVAVRRNLAPRDYERVRAAFRTACADPNGRSLVFAVFGGEDIREAVAEGHEALRRAYETAVASGLFD